MDANMEFRLQIPHSQTNPTDSYPTSVFTNQGVREGE
jgi:hypothetical protein